MSDREDRVRGDRVQEEKYYIGSWQYLSIAQQTQMNLLSF